MNKKILPIIITVIVAGASFYAGMKYSGSGQTNVIANGIGTGQFRQFGGTGTGTGTGGGQMSGTRASEMQKGNMTIGEILSKDDKSITLKIPTGGSKIIFYSASTKVSEMKDGSASDLKETDTISISGTTNPDGSITAESIQIRPPMPKISESTGTTIPTTPSIPPSEPPTPAAP